MMTNGWKLLETNTHQDHVVAHVIGATILGYFKIEDAVCLLLDIGFIWTVFVDGEMGLLPSSFAIKELALDTEEKARLLSDVRLLEAEGCGAHGLEQVEPAPAECLIEEVEFYGQEEERRRLLVKGEDGSIAIETSLSTFEIKVAAVPLANDAS